MLRALLIVFLLLSRTALAQAPADCQGRDLIAAMSPAERAALVAGVPYAEGNFWQATKGATTITIAGTYHLNDPRFDALVPRLLPYLDAASLLLVEAGPKEEKALKDAIAEHPERLIITDQPTLPEALPEADWQRLSSALRAQGIPAFLAAKFQPWYVAMLLQLPVCRMTPDVMNGLDQRLMAAAEAKGIPIRALEPWDTAIRLFDVMSWKDQIAMLEMSLASPGSPADLSTTLSNAYFAGEHYLIWAWSRETAVASAAPTPGDRNSEFARMESALLTGRTRSWVDPILAAADGRTVMVAVGAGHLGGKSGLLALLHQRGFTLARLPF